MGETGFPLRIIKIALREILRDNKTNVVCFTRSVFGVTLFGTRPFLAPQRFAGTCTADTLGEVRLYP